MPISHRLRQLPEHSRFTFNESQSRRLDNVSASEAFKTQLSSTRPLPPYPDTVMNSHRLKLAHTFVGNLPHSETKRERRFGCQAKTTQFAPCSALLRCCCAVENALAVVVRADSTRVDAMKYVRQPPGPTAAVSLSGNTKRLRLLCVFFPSLLFALYR